MDINDVMKNLLIDEDLKSTIYYNAKRLKIDIEEYYNYILLSGLYYNDCIEEENGETKMEYYLKGLKGESI